MSSNRLGDMALKRFCGLFEENSCILERLFLNNTKISLIGAEMLFDSLKHNSHLCELDLSDNDLSGHNINKIQILLWTNRELRKLNLANCMLGKEAA